MYMYVCMHVYMVHNKFVAKYRIRCYTHQDASWKINGRQQ